MATSLIRTTAPTVLPKTWANRIDWSHCWDLGAARGLLIIVELLGKHPYGEEMPRTAVRGSGSDPDQGETLLRFLHWLAHPPLGARLQKQLAEGMPRNSCHEGTLLCVPVQCQLSAKRVPRCTVVPSLPNPQADVPFLPLSPQIGEAAPQLGGSR